MSVGQAFERLTEIMHRLRSPGGCPWDAEQTHRSLKPYLIEEAYEVAEAIDHAADEQQLCSELGDLLLQILFHAEIASETGRFSIADVVRSISEKMVRRHPHVFADTVVNGAGDVVRNWSRIKAEERRGDEDRSALAGVPRGMPALLRAQRLGEKAEHAGFDWADAAGVVGKLGEEVAEIASALESGKGNEAVARELGDLLLAATSLARHVGASAEDVLNEAAERFARRFRHMERRLAGSGRELRDLSAEEQDSLWQEAKRQVE
jgi:tetrapyrrole methylase family protein/MazG family protein